MIRFINYSNIPYKDFKYYRNNIINSPLYKDLEIIELLKKDSSLIVESSYNIKKWKIQSVSKIGLLCCFNITSFKNPNEKWWNYTTDCSEDSLNKCNLLGLVKFRGKHINISKNIDNILKLKNREKILKNLKT